MNRTECQQILTDEVKELPEEAFPPVPLPTLERAYDIGKEEGLDFVYLGNVVGHPYENTYCPECGELLVQRWGLSVTRYRLKDNKCPRCGRPTSVVAGAGGTCYESSIDLPGALC